jgi:hypothetical protein
MKVAVYHTMAVKMIKRLQQLNNLWRLSHIVQVPVTYHLPVSRSATSLPYLKGTGSGFRYVARGSRWPVVFGAHQLSRRELVGHQDGVCVLHGARSSLHGRGAAREE